MASHTVKSFGVDPVSLDECKAAWIKIWDDEKKLIHLNINGIYGQNGCQ